jgi:hypothetical protein
MLSGIVAERIAPRTSRPDKANATGRALGNQQKISARRTKTIDRDTHWTMLDRWIECL